MKGALLLGAYNFALLLLSPFWLPYLAWEAFFGNLRGGWPERLGFPPLAPSGRPRVLVHAASAGEVEAARAIVRELKRLFPEAWVGLSVLTSTGFQVAKKKADEVDALLRAPLDLLPFVASFLSRLRPCVLCLVETELWPNLLHLARRKGTHCLLLSARFQRTMKSRLSRAIARLALGAMDSVLAQTERDAELARNLSAEGRARVEGNVKFDTVSSPLPEVERGALKEELGFSEGERVFVAGSTHPGEEGAVAEALSSLREDFPNLRAVVAPRKVERASEVAAVFERRGFYVSFRSRPEAGGRRPEVLVLDTIGELAKVYAIAEAAFVGGSIAPVGGHSLIEPMAQGVPVLFGPNVWNFEDVAAQAVESGAGLVVRGAGELTDALKLLLANRERRCRMAESALLVVERNRGAARRCAEEVLRWLREAR